MKFYLMLILLASSVIRAEEIDVDIKSLFGEHGFEIKTPKLNGSYSNSRIPLSASTLERVKVAEANREAFEIPYSLIKQNNEATDEVVDSVRNGILYDLKTSKDKKHLKYLLGYHDFVTPLARLIETKNIGDGLKTLKLTGRYQQKIKAICHWKNDDKPTILLLNGRATTPEAMFGLALLDYTNNVAAVYLQKLDVSVCAMEVGHLFEPSAPRLGLSGRGYQLSSVFDFLYFLKTRNEKSKIILGGLSNGGHLAEFGAILSDDVDALISAGASARYDYPYSRYTNARLTSGSAYTTLDFALRGKHVFDFIYPKPLLVSIGTHDAGFLREKVTKIDTINHIRNVYSDSANKLFIHVFQGSHAHDPNGESEMINVMLNRFFKSSE